MALLTREQKQNALMEWEQIRMQAISMGLTELYTKTYVPYSRPTIIKEALENAGLYRPGLTNVINMLSLTMPMGLRTSVRINLIDDTITTTPSHGGGIAGPWEIGPTHPKG